MAQSPDELTAEQLQVLRAHTPPSTRLTLTGYLLLLALAAPFIGYAIESALTEGAARALIGIATMFYASPFYTIGVLVALWIGFEDRSARKYAIAVLSVLAITIGVIASPLSLFVNSVEAFGIATFLISCLSSVIVLLTCNVPARSLASPENQKDVGDQGVSP